MAKLNFTIPSPLDQGATFEKIQKFLSKENDFKKFDPSVTCYFNSNDKACKIKGSQFTAELKVNGDSTEKPSDKSNIEITVEVGMALALFKGKIKEILEKTVHKVLKS